jgi:FlaA1/EpsC-like NDP-sugar epimerase
MNREGKTQFITYRWGNVLGSRGSVIPSFVKSIKADGIATITDMGMTRFWIRIQDAVKFILDTYQVPNSQLPSPRIPKMKAAKVSTVAQVIADILGRKEVSFRIIPIRPGEKIHEHISVDEHGESCTSSYDADQYTKEEIREMLLPIVRPNE